MALDERSKAVWPHLQSTNPMVYQKTAAATEPFLYHIDGYDLWENDGVVAPVTTIIYLTDGGANLVFPHGNNNQGIRQ